MLFLTATCESNYKRKAGGGGVGEGECKEKQEIFIITLGVSLQNADGSLMMSAAYWTRRLKYEDLNLWTKPPMEDCYASNHIQDPLWPPPAHAAGIWQKQQNKHDFNVTDYVWALRSVTRPLMMKASEANVSCRQLACSGSSTRKTLSEGREISAGGKQERSASWIFHKSVWLLGAMQENQSHGLLLLHCTHCNHENFQEQ